MDSNGDVVYTREINLLENGFECIITTEESFLPSGFWGSATLSSNGDIVVAVEDINESGRWAQGYLGFDLSTGSNTIYVPHCRKDNGWYTNILVTNVGSTSTDIELTYYRADGKKFISSIISNWGVLKNIPCLAAPITVPPPIPDENFLGTLRIDAMSSPIISLISENGEPGIPDRYGYPGLSTSSTAVYIPNVGSGLNSWKGTLSINNTASVTNTINISLYDQSGLLSYELVDSLPPFAMKQVEIDELINLPIYFEGSAHIAATSPIAVLINKER